MPEMEMTVKIDTAEIDEAIKKANRLVELLKEASTIASSLSGKLRLCVKLPKSYTNNLVIKNNHIPHIENGSVGAFHGDISKC